MSDDTIMVPMSRAQITNLIGLSDHECRADTECRNLLRQALAEHDRKAKLERYRLPWRADGHRLFLRGDITWVRPLIVSMPNEEIARACAGFPSLADATQRLLLCHDYIAKSRGNSSKAIEDLAQALTESGWPRSGG